MRHTMRETISGTFTHDRRRGTLAPSDGGCSSGVEHLVVVQDVAGSNPVSRPCREARLTGRASFSFRNTDPPLLPNAEVTRPCN